MTPLRAPRVVGVSGGVGTTTLATAVRGHDRGRALEHGVDILVCRSTGESLHAAAGVIAWLVGAGLPRPVLAVTTDGPLPVRGPLRARMRMMENQVAGLVVLPYVAHWRELTDPFGQVARLSECPAEQLPKTLRGYGQAIGRLAEAVLRSGLLQPVHGARVLPVPAPHPGTPYLGAPTAAPAPAPAEPPPGAGRPPAHHTGPRAAGLHTTGPRGVHQTGPRGVQQTGPRGVQQTGPRTAPPAAAFEPLAEPSTPEQPAGINNFGLSVAPAVLYGGTS